MTFQDRLYPPTGLRVLVTAGASGIGAAIASAFAEMGAEIHICDIDDAALAAFQQRFPSCQATHADVADRSAGRGAFRRRSVPGLTASMSWLIAPESQARRLAWTRSQKRSGSAPST